MQMQTKFLQPICAAVAVFVGPQSGSILWADSQKGPESELDGDKQAKRDKYLYIWAGDELGILPDFLAVVDFNEHSANYGEVIATDNAPTSGNEAHHCHISSDGNVILCGGLLSLLKDQDDIFFFDISKPKKPRFMSSTRTRFSSITDDPVPLAGGGFLVTMMGSAVGGEPGRVAEFDKELRLVHEWPDSLPTDGFNPHGISVQPEANIMITSDFINPVTTLVGYPGPLGIRGSIRVWNLASRSIVRSIPIPPAIGTMACQLIPGDPHLGAYTCGMFDADGGHLYYVDTQAGTYAEAFDTDLLLPGGITQIFAITADGTRLIVPISSYTAAGPAGGIVAMLDITDRTHATVVSVVDLGPGSAPHNLLLTRDQKRVVVTDYFLDEGSAGKIHFDGDDKVHVINLENDMLTLDTRFELDFSTAFSGIQARPHGIDVK
jgi:selenium-binding protein 1